MISPQQIRDELRGVFRGRLLADEASRSVYATDASPFQVMPVGVAIPSDEADLRALVRYASENQLPLIPRGGGTGLAGESLGPGLVVDLSIHFRRIGPINAESVTAQPGVTYANLNRALAPHGRRFAPNPASGDACTLGGMVATNASGGNAFRFGYTRDYLLGLRAIWDSGDCDDLRANRGFTGPRGTEPSSRLIEIRAQTAALLAAHRDLIQLTRPATRFNRCGYVLHDILSSGGLDLGRLLVGSEGTLALMSELTLATVPLPGGICLAAFGFANQDTAIRAGLALRSAEGIVGCDLLDQRLIALSRAGRPDEGIGLVPPAVTAALVVTFEGDTEREALRFGRAAIDRLQDNHRLGVLAEPTCEPEGVTRIRRFRDAAVSGLYALGMGARPVACIEDVAVPAEELPRFLTELRGILQRFDLTGSILCHVLAGQIHTRPFVDLNDPTDRARLWPLAEAVHAQAIALGGTVSTQHGTGLARTPWVEKQYGPLVPVFQELKRIFDPRGILNPGKIVGPDPSRPAWPLRPERITPTAEPRVPLLVWPSDGPAAEAASCNGCGDCRTRTAPTRMCPIFHSTAEERAAPRAKATLLRQLAETDFSGLSRDDVRAVAALCVNCKMCRDECRTRVNIPKLMLEAKASYHAENGLDRADWTLARVETLSTLAGNFSFTTNALLGSRAIRWGIEKLFGLSRRRTLPKFTHRTFLRRAHIAGLTRRPQGKARGDAPRVALFVDSYVNTIDPLIGEAAVAVLRHHGIEVHVPPRQRSSGMAPLGQGDLEAAREVAAHNVRLFADLVRDGYRVICAEPTAAVALTQDYLDLFDEPDARLVARNTTELTSYLGELLDAGTLRTDFRPLDLTLGHHVPCHQKALRGPIAGPRLLEQIPGLRVHTIDLSCSGMAGAWGLRADHYEASMAAGEPMLAELRRPRILFGSTECGSCRMQMQDGAGKRTLHPVEYLALAYGYLPELEAKLRRPLGTLVTD